MDATTARHLFWYEPKMGILLWKNCKTRPDLRGKHAGKLEPDGALRVKANGKLYLNHRIIWLMVYGEWPICEIDHKNGKRSDNKLKNLRDTNKSGNQCNKGVDPRNTSGRKGISWHPLCEKWQARITKDNKRITLGYFASIDDASAAYEAKAAELHGEFYYKLGCEA